MSKAAISKRRREQIAVRAGFRCSYCRSSQGITGTAMQIDHIEPEARGGSNEDDNLCWCCGECNSAKGCAMSVIDPVTSRVVSLFHPNRQHWSEHFVWRDGGALIEGQTSIGRATVQALQLNRPWLVHARRRWLDVGWHPPVESGSAGSLSR